MTSMRRTRWGPFSSLFFLAPVLIGVPWISYRQHTALPEPVVDPTNPVTGLPQLSETQILGVSKYLSEDIGFRTPGTLEHLLGDQWMYGRVEEFKQRCDEIVAATQGSRKLECEIWRQEGSGSHRFDMMGNRLYKTYVSISNIVVRLSDGTPQGKEHAVLVNAHLDSTLPTPGAADDALSVGVMLDCMRVLVETDGWSPRHAIVFLFNNAEESLQDGSHLFSTQHSVASTIRAVVNLEAAGTTGRELLFQATSEQMIEAYSHVPRRALLPCFLLPSISGIILSDTDFRQFQQYLNVTGLDIAVVGNSYLYHMRKDLVENIQPGVAQHMAENTLALLQYLSSHPDVLPSLTGGYTPPTTVYYSLLGFFFMYSFRTAMKMHLALMAGSMGLVGWLVLSGSGRGQSVKKARDGKVSRAVEVVDDSLTVKALAHGATAATLGIIGCLLLPNILAVVMARVLGNAMSWFSNEYSALVLYGPAACLGTLLSQLLISPVHETAVYSAILLIQSFLAVIVQFLGVGSASLFFVSSLSLFFALLLNPLLSGSGSDLASGSRRDLGLSLATYALGQVLPLTVGTMAMLPTLEVFVPLTGRMGGDVPADNLISTIVAAISALAVPLFLPFVHRFGRSALVKAIMILGVVSVVPIAIFSVREPFDEMHQKRVFVLRTENVTTGEHHLHLSTPDGAPGFEALVHEIAKAFGRGPEESENEEAVPVPVIMDHYNSDWDPMFPYSMFLTPYKVPLWVDPEYVSPWTATGTQFSITAEDDTVDFVAGTRTLKLRVYHPGLIWTVIAFDAHVLKWNLDENPPDEYTRHHVKETSFYGKDSWSIDLVIKLPQGGTTSEDAQGILVNFIGLQEKGMWPGKKALLEAENVDKNIASTLVMFRELDEWIEQRTGGKVDAMLLGCVAGVQRKFAPDGFNRDVVVASTQSNPTSFNAPLIKGTKGGRFSVNVFDQLNDDTMAVSTSIHWHGILQRHTTWADGPSGVSQCPIAPGQSFEYDFAVPGQAGTFWYHSHFRTQYCDGLRGPLVIYDPHDPHAHLYDVDDESTIITLADWFHDSTQFLADQRDANGNAFPSKSNSTLINGAGRFPGGPQVPLSVINVEHGKRYRMRLVSMSCDSSFQFSIDGHNMTIIEADGIETQPLTVNSLQIFAAQRYSFVLNANQPVGNYRIRAQPPSATSFSVGFDGGLNSAILRYKGAPNQEPNSTQQTSLAQLNDAQLVPLVNPGAPGGSAPADVVLDLVLGFNGTGFQINGTQFVPPNELPVLLQILSGKKKAQELLPAGSVYGLPLGKTIEIRLFGAGAPGGPHPFHLHGHAFDVVQGLNQDQPNYKNPVRRDVTPVNGASPTIIRFKTDNPGPWMLHCHIDFHLDLGLAVVLAEDIPDVKSFNPVPAAWKKLCTDGVVGPDE
ncbi:hypothetical protein D9758_017096 [Tetrapyrgos nigripes]|uniref:Peptide hydrolase n=1 Tax=Tetrapyrgos nigripes TaxID=182062 RepID=A0A8H5C2Z3_9AGAR|nr:hypothetical protein D9758_017096 [Tetrapyrgos nigripes]